VELREADAHDFLTAYPFLGRELVYCDPPYLHSTRTSNKRYKHEYTEADHQELLNILGTLPVPVILSAYPSELYDDILLPEGWRRITIQAATRGGPRTEVIWHNYEITSVHWAAQAGRNYNERQDLRRKAARWRARYEAMPPAHRLAVLAAIMAVESEGG